MYSPISRFILFTNKYFRERIRKQNINDNYHKNKYFNEEFNVFEFAMKINTAFTPACSWRTIGGNHTAHISVVEISLHILEYGFINKTEIDIFEKNIFSIVPII